MHRLVQESAITPLQEKVTLTKLPVDLPPLDCGGFCFNDNRRPPEHRGSREGRGERPTDRQTLTDTERQSVLRNTRIEVETECSVEHEDPDLGRSPV